MRVVILGSGGREHAIALKVSESELLKRLYIIPGNPGTKSLGENINIDLSNRKNIINFCRENLIDLVIIGPEQPLVEGLADNLRDNKITVFGPNAEAALIEGEKSFAKELMRMYNIPTADFGVFHKSNYKDAVTYADKIGYPVVIKASGLAAGKGVLICENQQESLKAIDDCFSQRIFGESGETIVIEEYMEGEEASIFAITDGKEYVILPSSQDHKRIFDGDKGKNTGGMGAYSPAPIITNEMLIVIEDTIIKPTIAALSKERKFYTGCLYCGLMITKNGPKVVEYNCRFGDPEIQAVLPVLEGDFLKLLFSASIGNIDKNAIKYNNGSAVCVIATSGGYPDKYDKGFEIQGLNQIHNESVIIYHAGTKEIEGKIVTNGGRVLGITGFSPANNLTYCKKIAYDALGKINFQNIYYRMDIADKAINR